MAELINILDAVIIIEREKDMNTLTEWGKGFMDALNTIEENLELLPVISESEIRAKAIDEFAEEMKKMCNGITILHSIIYEIAEQLKEET